MASADNAIKSNLTPTDLGSEFAMRNYHITSVLSRVATSTPVQVVAVGTDGLVDVQPLVNRLDVQGTGVPFAPIHGLVVFQTQAGNSGIIVTPEVGDIGYAVFADRDISSVIAARGQANAGSWRRFDMSDGVYFGGILNTPPTQFVKFDPLSGITITSPIAVTVNAPMVVLGDGGAAQALMNASLVTWLDTHTHATTGAPPSTSVPTTAVTTTVLGQ